MSTVMTSTSKYLFDAIRQSNGVALEIQLQSNTVNGRNELGQTPLLYAVSLLKNKTEKTDYEKCMQIITRLLKCSGISVNACDSLGNNIIMLAAAEEDLSLLEYIIKYHREQFDLNAKNKEENTALQILIQKETKSDSAKWKMINLLVENGADPKLNAKNDPKSSVVAFIRDFEKDHGAMLIEIFIGKAPHQNIKACFLVSPLKEQSRQESSELTKRITAIYTQNVAMYHGKSENGSAVATVSAGSFVSSPVASASYSSSSSSVPKESLQSDTKKLLEKTKAKTNTSDFKVTIETDKLLSGEQSLDDAFAYPLLDSGSITDSSSHIDYTTPYVPQANTRKRLHEEDADADAILAATLSHSSSSKPVDTVNKKDDEKESKKLKK